MRQSMTGLITAAVALLFVFGCEGDPGPAGPPGPPGSGVDGSVGAAVIVSPAIGSVAVGETIALTASSADAMETFTWASSDETIATVDDLGTVTGVAEGTAFIVATGGSSGSSAPAVVTVTRSTSVSFADDILPLFTGKDVWYVGGEACNTSGCHTGVGSAHDLEMGTYAGILAGADGGGEPILIPSNAADSSLRRRLRNNRMPWGISVFVPRNGPPVSSVRDRLGWSDASSATDENGVVKLVEAWIDGDAPNGSFPYLDSAGATVTKTFATDILPLFTTEELWEAGTHACNAAGCHTGVGGAHDLDMGTYAGIIAGADGGSEPILVPGNAAESSLRGRLRNNRMPWGMPTWVPRDGPAGQARLVTQWIDEGAIDD